MSMQSVIEISKFIKSYQCPVKHFYRDRNGNVAIGPGFIVRNIKKAMALPMFMDLSLASKEHIAKEYKLIKQLPHGPHYPANYYRVFSELHLNVDELDILTNQCIVNWSRELKTIYKDFDNYPTTVKIALCCMILDVGHDCLVREYRQFNYYITAHNWLTSAKYSIRRGVSNYNNHQVKQLLLNAAFSADDGLGLAC